MTPTPRFLVFLSLGILPAALAAWLPFLLYVALAYDATLIALAALERAFGVSREKLSVERAIPGKICVGIENSYSLVIRSFHPARMSLEVVDGWPAEFEVAPAELRVRLEPYEQKTVTMSAKPGGRGEFPLGPIHVRARTGLGLLRRRLVFGEAQLVRVYPNLRELRRYDLLARRRLLRHEGFRSVRRVGEGREFERLREYSPDDDFRAIDWKATARRRRPITRLYETERGQNVIVALDAGRLMAATTENMTKLDHAVNAALMLGYVALRSHDRVGLVVFSSEVDRIVPPRAGRAALAQIMEALVPLQPRITFSDYRVMAESIATRLRRRSLVVLFTDLADPQAAREVNRYLPMLRPMHVPVCVAFRDPGLVKLATAPPSFEGMYDHVAALELHREWRHTLGELRKGGVAVVDVLPHQAAVAAVNKYLELKKRQLI